MIINSLLSCLNVQQIMITLGFIVLFVLVDIIFVVYLSRKYKVNPFNIKKMMEAWNKEFS